VSRPRRGGRGRAGLPAAGAARPYVLKTRACACTDARGLLDGN